MPQPADAATAPLPRLSEGGTVTESCVERARACAVRVRLERRLDDGTLATLLSCRSCPARQDPWTLLLRLLPHATDATVRFHRPGARATTFDEAWLSGLIASIRRGDDASVIFALCSRVARRHRAAVLRLAEECAATLDASSLEPF